MTENDFILFDRIEVIKKTIEKYGEENFYISFSGGKDSTVLHHLIDEAIPGNQIPRVFMNTGIEYNDIRRFVEELTENDFRFVIVNSKVNIPQMLKEKGYPFKSKFHAEQVRRFQLKGDFEKTNRNYYEGVKASGVEESAKFKCPGILKYQFSKDFDIPLSPNCCNELKKKPLHKWEEENKRKKQREDAIKINGFIRLDKSSASEIDKQIEQTYLSLQKNIKFVCTNKDLMNSMLDELDYIVYASKLYGGKHVMEELDNRYRNKLMS